VAGVHAMSAKRGQQQRRVARRFKRMLRQTQHHQRGRIDPELIKWAAYTVLASLVVFCLMTLFVVLVAP
jgi:hypothetical protein